MSGTVWAESDPFAGELPVDDLRLQWVSAGSAPPAGWVHPRWDDDAFGFVLVVR